MIIKNKIHLNRDSSGDLIITIPESCSKTVEHERLLKTIELLITSPKKKHIVKGDWRKDSAVDVVGIGKSDSGCGSVNHDKFIYGLS